MNILNRPLLRGDESVLAAQVTSLARLGLGRIAGRDLAALVRVQVRAGSSAVAVLGDGLLVDVVQEWTASIGKARELDGELDTGTIGAGDGHDGACERAASFGGEGRDVAGSAGVASYNGCGRDSRGLRARD
jgi:hypothetical protein